MTSFINALYVSNNQKVDKHYRTRIL